jgi:hypothetical protein
LLHFTKLSSWPTIHQSRTSFYKFNHLISNPEQDASYKIFQSFLWDSVLFSHHISLLLVIVEASKNGLTNFTNDNITELDNARLPRLLTTICWLKRAASKTFKMLIFKVHYCLVMIYRDCFIYCIYDVNITILIKYRNTIHLF